MNTKFFYFGCLLLLVIGTGLVWYAWRRLLWVLKIKKRMLSIPVISLSAWVIPIEKVSRFRWTELAPAIRYSYKVGDREYVGERLYLEGNVSYEDKRDAEKYIGRLGRIGAVYFDPLQPEFSTVYLEMAPSKKANYYAVLAGGGVVLVAGLALFLIKYL